MKSPFAFRQHGESGRWVSEVFPHLATRVDDLAFLMALASRTNVHGPASYLMNTGFLMPGFPCLGAWVSYGLGALGDNLPTFVVLPDPKGLPYNAKGNFSSRVPADGPPGDHHQRRRAGADRRPVPAQVGQVPQPPGRSRGAATPRRDEPASCRAERGGFAARIPDRVLRAGRPYAVRAHPRLSTWRARSDATRRLYGLDEPATADFGRRCLLARRLLERGVRFVQVWSGAGGPSNNWDNHADIPRELPAIARTVNRPTAGLLLDLKARGLFDDTLVVWTTEFGRMPFTQGATGRDHNGGTSVAWLAGAGVKAGVAHGESDPWSWRAASGSTTGYDLHATILHLLGIDHERLTVRHDGIDRRLTDVHGRVIRDVLS